MADNSRAKYSKVIDDHFPPHMKITFHEGDGIDGQTLHYEKVTWNVGGEEKGLRYGENPGQEAALFKLVGGNLQLGDVEFIGPGNELVAASELIQSGKHPGKINLTDVDNSLNILRYLTEMPTAVIVKHNNPCGVAQAGSLAEAYDKANMADRLAAFGGAVTLNRACDVDTAKLIAENYTEVVTAPEFEEGVMDILSGRKNLRVIRIGNMARLQDFSQARFIDFKSLIDGSIVPQWNYIPDTRTMEALKKWGTASTVYKDQNYTVDREPSEAQYQDMLFGWMVEAGVTSNSVIYVKDGVTVGIGTGEQDRVGVAEIARDKAYRKLADRISWQRHQKPYNNLEWASTERETIDDEVNKLKGGLIGSCMISDAFFPYRDGIEVGLREGVTSVLQPGGSMRDFESIEACNEYKATMVLIDQRSFKH